MEINSVKFGLAGAITAAVLWMICSMFVGIVPGPMMNLTTNMMHMEMGRGTWNISLISVIWGLIAWSFFAGIFSWLLATIYNLLAKN